MTTSTNAPLMWTPPAMNNPTIIDLGQSGGQDHYSFSDSQDVIFLGGDQPLTMDKLQIQGGHNVMVLGGDFEPSGQQTGTLQFYGVSGEAWVDGVHIDNKNTHGGQDAIDISGGGKQPDLVVQNTLIENVHGAHSAGHADVIQTQGTAGDIKVYNLTGETNYQGLFLAPQYQPETKSATLDNVNLRYSSDTSDDGSHTTYLLWTLDNSSEKPYPVSFDNVFVQPRSGQSAIQDTVWPKDGMGAHQSGDEITWSGLPYTGHVTVGQPAHDFADTSKIGLNFKDSQVILDAVTNGGSLATVGSPEVSATTADSADTAGTTVDHAHPVMPSAAESLMELSLNHPHY